MTTANDILKQFGGSDTAFASKQFSRAVWLMTAHYALAAFVILGLYSLLVYFLYIHVLPPEVDVVPHGTESLLEDFAREPLGHELRENLLRLLLVVDMVLFAGSVLVGYILSRLTLAPIARMYDRQRRFVAEAAHELRTPLAVLRVGSEHMSARTRSFAEYRQFADTVHRQAIQLSGLSNDLLFLARYDEHPAVSMKPVDLSALVERTVADMRYYADSRDCMLETVVEPGAVLSGDADHLARLMQNLLKNAIDYNVPHGTVTVRLMRSEKGDVVLSVIDTGIGIAEVDREHIFERFYRSEAVHERDVPGSGLGLAIVSEIARAHHATIELESAMGRGTTITLHFQSKC